MKNCKGCMFAEGRGAEFIYCKNFEKSVACSEVCSKFITNTLIINSKFSISSK